MPDTTPILAIRYPLLADPADAQGTGANVGFEDSLGDLEKFAVMRFASAAARTAAVSAPVEGMLSFQQDVNRFEYYDGVNWVSERVFARKTADEVVNNSAVLQNDNHLAVPVAAGVVYDFFLSGDQTSNATPGFKFAWTFPTGLTMRYGLHCIGAGGSNEFIFPSDQTTVHQLAGGGARRVFWARGLVVVGGTAGTLQLQWSQITANPSDTTLHANSYLRLDPVA